MLSDYWYNLLLVSTLALLLDRLLGEPERHHPLVWFGTLASRLEHRLNGIGSVWAGTAAALLAVAGPLAAVAAAQEYLEPGGVSRFALDTLVLWFVLGWQSMKEHARAVAKPLLEGNLDLARSKLSLIVSRDTNTLDHHGVAGSAIESVLENGHDSAFASLFWYAALGPAGALAHRLVNTLDAMWGYRNERFRRFGWFAARTDDVLGWVPARLTALSYALCGAARSGFRCWRTQAGSHKSPNAGVVMAAGAGALRVRIGGPMYYAGRREDKPELGAGPRGGARDIERAIRLVQRGLVLWLSVFFACAMVW